MISTLICFLLIGLACYTQVDRSKDPPETVRRAVEKVRSRTKPLGEPDWKAIRGVERFRRGFILRREELPVGRALLTVRMFQDGQIVRTGLEYWAFAADQDGKHDYFWFQGFTSEFASSRAAVAEWATGREDELGMNYRFQGAGRGLADFEGNLFNFGQRNPKKIKLPENYRLLQALAARLRETFSGKVGRVFEWKRYGWRQWEPSWYRYQYIYEGPDVVSLVDGSSLPAYRFLVKPIGVKAPVEKLWVDQEGYPLRRVVRLGNADWELIAAKEPEAAKSKFVKWKALNQDHKKEAKAFLQSLGVWF